MILNHFRDLMILISNQLLGYVLWFWFQITFCWIFILGPTVFSSISFSSTNSKFYAVHRLLELLVNKLAVVFGVLNIPRFKPIEINFFREYDTAMQPVASTLGVLHGDKNCFCRLLLPKLVQTRIKSLSLSLKAGNENRPQFYHARSLLIALFQGAFSRSRSGRTGTKPWIAQQCV